MFGRPFGRPDRPRTALLPCLFRRPRGCCRRGRHVRLRRPMGTCRAKLPDPPRLAMWVLLGGRLGRVRLRTRLEGHHHVHDPAGLPRGRDRVPPATSSSSASTSASASMRPTPGPARGAGSSPSGSTTTRPPATPSSRGPSRPPGASRGRAWWSSTSAATSARSW